MKETSVKLEANTKKIESPRDVIDQIVETYLQGKNTSKEKHFLFQV